MTKEYSVLQRLPDDGQRVWSNEMEKNRMKWISVNDTTQKPIEGPRYLIYGDQLSSHCPDMSVGWWNEKTQEWHDYDDREYIYREYEVDAYIRFEDIPKPASAK